MKKIVLLLLLISSHAFSQSVNDYQYVVVPQKFSIFSESNKFNLNNSVKMLLQKYGFKSYLETETLPFEIINSNCNKLHADLVKESNVFATKIKVVLKDCSEKVLYETAFGKSNEKDLAIAFNQALREAGKSFESLNYKYNGKNGSVTETNLSEKLANKAQSLEIIEATPTSAATKNPETFYFAQPTANGFQVVNNEPRVIMRLFNTSQKNVFIANKDAVNGVVINKEGQWFFEFYANGKLVSESLNLKF
ncbi:hypothetical protein [Flavobacterium wongokense]|uniref:hypothetical protein n=1 Tax=Flavobacterium wongokense TaxID=2910674 RepID=UPI001F30D3A3|nr:hypothetical protein [Flavobacterium sp. WG47]MCF6133081.1 hypothetical protein [Flavobacterium sp. WG47]